MMSNNFCKGGCGNTASRKGWCKLKWEKGRRFAVDCPTIEERRAKSISAYRVEEAKQGGNPMQNPEICKKNHSVARNKKASETLRQLGKLGLLPQQVESIELKEKRNRNNQKALQEIWKDGKHPLQSKSEEEIRKIRLKISKTLSDGIVSGRIKATYGGKKVYYKDIIFKSTWEKETALFLDRNGVKWEYETLSIPYYDSARDVVAHTIPDFLLPEYNTIIEVKGRSFNSSQTKDKMDAIHALKYNTFLIGESQIKRIKQNDLSLLRSIKNEKS